MNDDPVLLREPREGVPQVTDTVEGFEDYCDRLSAVSGPLAADAERASGYRYGHDDWLIQFKRDGAGIGLLDPMALNAIGVDWGMFNRAVGDATWILHDAKQDLPGFAQLSLTPHALFDTEIAARILGLHRFGLAYVTEHYLGMTLAKEHSAADWSYRPLPRDWRNYAALDVELLIPLAHKMTLDLKRAGKWEWACQEFEYVLRTELHPRRPHAVPWLRISHINTIQRDRRALAIAKELWTELETPGSSVPSARSTSACACTWAPTKTRCSSGMRRSSAKSSRACGSRPSSARWNCPRANCRSCRRRKGAPRR